MRYKALEWYLLADESDLYERQVMASVMAGQCEIYIAGDKVWRESNTGWDGFVSVRKQRQAKAYWIRGGALNKLAESDL